jgi:hypothetical protein
MIRGELRLSGQSGIPDWPTWLLSLPVEGFPSTGWEPGVTGGTGPSQPKCLRLFPEVTLTKVSKQSRRCIDWVQSIQSAH